MGIDLDAASNFGWVTRRPLEAGKTVVAQAQHAEDQPAAACVARDGAVDERDGRRERLARCHGQRW